MPAGYSKRSLAEKLGIRPGHRVGLVGAPKGYEKLLAPLPEGATLSRTLRGRFDLVQAFVTARKDLASSLERWRKGLDPAAPIWISWPKKTSGVATDVTEDVVRAVALPRGLVDIKVCAVDEVWSGLKLVVRKENRK